MKPGGKTDEDDKVVDDEVVPDPEPEVVEQTLTHLAVNGETSTYSLEKADTFTLEIRTIGDSWIGVLDSSNKERMTPAHYNENRGNSRA